MAVDVGAWLRGLGLERYAEAFRDAEITPETLPELTDADLRELGLPLGPRKLVLKAIRDLAHVPASEPRAEASRTDTKPDTASIPSQAERRQLTVMFVDLVGSTALSARLDPEEMRSVLLAYQNAVAGEIARFGGHMAKLMGDGVLAYFGWPRADEDEAERAVRAGLAVVEAVAGLTAPDGAELLAARVGIATGLVVVGELVGEGTAQEEAVVGETPNLAARLQEVAPSGAVVVADATRRLLGEMFDLHPLGPARLKGFARPLTSFRIVGERPVSSRFEARRPGRPLPMVGRDQELALVLERWHQAVVGEGQAMLVVGEPGIGKSRLVRAVLDALEGEEHTALRYQCSPHHIGTALWPICQQLARAAGLTPDDGDAARLDKLEAVLRQRTHDTAGTVPLIAALLGIDVADRYPVRELTPQQRRLHTLAALVGQLFGLARRRGPVLMVLEDAHWADPTTLEFLGLTLDRIAGARVLMLLTSRPDGQPALGGHPNMTRLTLNRLGRSPTEAIVARLAGDRVLPAEVLGEIAARTDGVPLFVEELTKAVLETAAPGAAVPATLHASLMARLDRVPGVKEVAQVAACVGREFAYPLLAAVSSLPELELRAALDRLAAAELVFARGEPPEAAYTFKHALVRDAAYESLLRADRQQLHARIARVLEERFPATAASEPELLARHVEAAGEVARAVELWAAAGRAATRRYANAEAIEHLEAALRLLRSLPATAERDRRELDLRLAAGMLLIAVRGHAAPEVEAAYGRAQVLAERLADGAALFAALRGSWNYVHDRGELDRAIVLAERLVAVAGARGDAEERALAWRALGSTHLVRGELEDALEAFGRGLEICAGLPADACLRAHGEAPGIICAQFAGRAHALAGRPDTGLALVRRGVDEARRLGHPVSLGFALAIMGLIHTVRREPDACGTAGTELLALSGEHGFGFYASCGEILLGWARTQTGDLAGGIELLGRGLSGWRANGTLVHVPTWLGLLADALLEAGRVGEAAAVLEDALALALPHHQLYAVADLHRLCGRVALAQARRDEAAATFALALHAARESGARLLELRAAADLARLWADEGKRQKARDLLAPICAWFTEGFGTADLKEAGALLEELAA
jgi:class 3 adenylate cyclase/predicted ATPase